VNNLLESLGALALQNPEWTKFIIGIGILIQGEIAILLAMYLILGNHVSFWGFVEASLLGLFIGEFLIYVAGRTLRTTRFGWKLSRKLKTNRRVRLYSYYITKNRLRMLFLAKFLPGVNTLSILLLGWMRVKVPQFFRVYIPAALFWFVSTAFVAYSIAAGLRFLKSSRIFEQIEFVIAGLIVVFFIAEWGVKKLLAKYAPTDLPPFGDEK
jgi:membrane protein DedA with SNARE-associated domain